MEALKVDENRRRLIREGSCFCWQCCTKLFQNGLYCQGLFSFRLGLAFPLHVLTMTARVEGEGGWSVWESVSGLFSPCSYLVLLQAVQCFGGEMSLKSWGVKLRTKAVSTQWGPLLSSSQHQMQMAAYKNLPFYGEAAENEAHGFVELERKQSPLILASVLFQSWRGRRPYLFVAKEALTRPQIIPAKPVQIKVCTAQSCEN